MKKITLLKQNLCLLVIFCILSITVSAQNTGMLSGKVVDKDGNSLPGAQVYISDYAGTVADIDGNYSFEIPTGNQTVTVSFVGYSSQTFTINVQPGSSITKDFTLATDAFGLNDIVVTATYATRTQKESPISLTALNEKQLIQLSSNSQADILRTVPGITAEGGGGEVASNVFIRGLPSGGQYVFNPLQFDGMPVMSTFGLNSSAHDVYVRTDIGMRNLEFARGGVSSLFGAGSVAGIINYSSKTGDRNPGNILQMEWADKGRLKFDFYSGGKLGGDESNTYYALTGFYRYDEGPIYSGLPSDGFQLRGNIKKVFDKGSFTLHGQYIDDKVQFFLPLVRTSPDFDNATGDNGEEIKTFQTQYAQFSYPTPGGVFETPIGDGVVTKGGYFMGDLKYDLGESWKLKSKLRFAKYDHQFNLFLPSLPQSISDYASSKITDINSSTLSATYVGTNQSVPGSNMFLDRTLDRNRPMKDLSAEVNITKIIENESAIHTFTAGTFMSYTWAGDFNVVTQYATEFNDAPRLIDISAQDNNGNTYNLTSGGVTDRGNGYNNKQLSATKIAGYLMDEIKIENWRIDLGLRLERTEAKTSAEGSQSYTIDTTSSLVSTLQNVNWGNGQFTKGFGGATDLAFVLAGLYKMSDELSLYGNFSKGYFFPQPRGIKVSNGVSGSYETEGVIQAELGAKYGNEKLSGTFAFFYNALKDRRDVKLVNTANGGVTETVTTQDTRSFGIEASWDYRLSDDFSFFGNATYQSHEYTAYEGNPDNVGNWLERQPKFLSRLGLNYDNQEFDANVSWNYMGGKYPNAANTFKLDAINIVRFDLGYTFALADESSLRFGISAFNLFNDNGLTEGDPRNVSQTSAGDYVIGRPILPRRFFVRAAFNF